MTIETAIPAIGGASPSPKGKADPGSVDRQMVVCVVAGERYGIDVSRVHEIIRLPAITALPGAHPSMSGVINLRGRIIPIMDLRDRFGLAPAEPTRLSRIVVADAAGVQIGLVVDGVDEVVHLDASTIEPTPTLTAGTGPDHLSGIARVTDGLIILLDLDRLLATDRDAASGDPEPGASA